MTERSSQVIVYFPAGLIRVGLNKYLFGS